MYRLTSQLIIYRNIGEDSILFRLADICRRLEEGSSSKECLAEETLTEVHRLLDLATQYGFNDNLWHNYLAFLLADTETPFTLVSEKVGANEGSVNTFAKNDFMLFKKLFDYDFSKLEETLQIPVFTILENFQAVEKKSQFYNKNVSDKIRALSRDIEGADTEEELYRVITDFYRRVGVGKFGLNKAFRISEEPDKELLIPITNTGEVHLDDLVGYESQKRRLIENTEAFVARRESNNVLLYGDAGTGKSTSVKAILNMYYDQGLRMIEIYKHQFEYLSKVISEIKHRNYRFIIYMDDLSFEETELGYKYLKAVIEGGLEPKPENVLIYATSNRRHLVRETWKDQTDADSDDMHRNDTVEEKMSLANRFGVSIGYFKPDHEEYLNIVDTLVEKYPQILLSGDELHRQAVAWSMRHGGRTGRTAQQFVTYLAGISEN